MFTITDEIGDNVPVIVRYADEIACTIWPWFAEAPPEMLSAVEMLQTLAMRGDYYGEYESFLGVKIHRAGAL